mmetsp:Transcript_65481/g.206915  ORF Transcript_65481/g.206915 Transcript_65481/m.206915 type:complete len:339 (-) Transcript_65481:84-1100(-)
MLPTPPPCAAASQYGRGGAACCHSPQSGGLLPAWPGSAPRGDSAAAVELCLSPARLARPKPGGGQTASADDASWLPPVPLTCRERASPTDGRRGGRPKNSSTISFFGAFDSLRRISSRGSEAQRRDCRRMSCRLSMPISDVCSSSSRWCAEASEPSGPSVSSAAFLWKVLPKDSDLVSAMDISMPLCTGSSSGMSTMRRMYFLLRTAVVSISDPPRDLSMTSSWSSSSSTRMGTSLYRIHSTQSKRFWRWAAMSRISCQERVERILRGMCDISSSSSCASFSAMTKMVSYRRCWPITVSIQSTPQSVVRVNLAKALPINCRRLYHRKSFASSMTCCHM